MRKFCVIGICALTLSACASLPPPVIVQATGETRAAPSSPPESLGNPTLWRGGMGRDETGLAQDGFLVATARTHALIIHDFNGAELQRLPGARLADIDVSVAPLEGSYAVVIGGTEQVRRRTRIALYRLDRGEGQLVRRWGEIETDLAQPAGFCMRQVMGVLRAAVIDQRGEVRQLEISEGRDGEPVVRETRRYRIADTGEGCAIDPVSGQIFFSHKTEGFWAASVSPTAAIAPVRLVDAAPRGLPRSLGVAFLSQSRNRYLISLDQDHAAFSVWRLTGDGVDWVGRVEVREQPDGRAVRNRIGLDAFAGDVGPFSEGLVVVQDQADDGSPNLKLVDWGEVRRALGL